MVHMWAGTGVGEDLVHMSRMKLGVAGFKWDSGFK